MIKSINHFSFTVSSLENSIKFYKNILGLKLLNVSERETAFSSKVTGIKDAYLRIAYLESTNCAIELIEYLCPKNNMRVILETCDVGSAHVCFNVQNFNYLIRKLKEKKIHFKGEICLIPEGPNKGKKVLYFADPDGNTLELISDK